LRRRPPSRCAFAIRQELLWRFENKKTAKEGSVISFLWSAGLKIVGIKTTLFDDSQTASLKSHRKCLPGIANTQCLVELTSDGGVAGVAIAPEWARQAIVLLAEAVVLGEEVSGTASLWHNMGQVLAKWGDGVFQRARAALDIALWDLKARARDEPLWKDLKESGLIHPDSPTPD